MENLKKLLFVVILVGIIAIFISILLMGPGFIEVAEIIGRMLRIVGIFALGFFAILLIFIILWWFLSNRK